jgi:hypothetical protein
MYTQRLRGAGLIVGVVIAGILLHQMALRLELSLLLLLPLRGE